MACGSDGDAGAGGKGGGGDENDPLANQFANGDGGGGGGGDGGQGENCFAPVDMYIMLDRSGSMDDDCNIGENVSSKWCHAITAMSGYFKSQGATDQAVALQFFPSRSHDDDLCDTGDGYEVAAVPANPAGFVTLPSGDFDAVLNDERPGGGGRGLGTPTEAAIRGLVRFTSENRRPGRVTIGILVTDGDPNGCNENLDFLAGLLDAHHQATQIRTYVIGMEEATFSNLEQIAQGGGAPEHPDAVGVITDACGNGDGPCRHWNVGNGDPAVFTAALAAIQESADGCTEGGGVINPPK